MHTSFTRHDQMLLSELGHNVLVPLDIRHAMLVRMELGEPSFTSRLGSSWYAIAHIDNGGDCYRMPFALRIDIDGKSSLVVPFESAGLAGAMVGSLVPDFLIEELPERTHVTRRYR